VIQWKKFPTFYVSKCSLFFSKYQSPRGNPERGEKWKREGVEGILNKGQTEATGWN